MFFIILNSILTLSLLVLFDLNKNIKKKKVLQKKKRKMRNVY